MGNTSPCRAGKLHFPLVCVHTQIKSVLRERPVIQGKWRTGGGEEHTHRGRKLRLGKSFLRIVNVLHRK